MQHLFQSAFLQALGYAIVSSLWQLAFLWLVFLALNGLIRWSAAHKYRLAVALQVGGFLWFLVTLQFYYAAYREAGTATESFQLTTLSSNSNLQTQLINWFIKAEQLLPYLSAAYLLLIGYLCFRWVIGYRRTQLIRTQGISKIPPQWRIFVRDLAAQLGINRKVEIFLSDTIHTPLTIGFWKPLILVPIASINHLSAEQLEAVILHEMAHIRRYDYLVNILLSVVEISLFFNPFSQLLGKVIKKERENSCDDWVLQFQYSATTYAQALLQIATLSTPAFAMTAVNNSQDLLSRVKRMLNQPENSFNYRRQLLAFLLVTGMLSSIAWLNPDTTQHRKPAPTVTLAKQEPAGQQAMAEPMAINVDNPLFNPMFFLSEPLKKQMKKNMEEAAKEIHRSAGKIEAVTPVVSAALHTASNEMAAIDWDNLFTVKAPAVQPARIKIDTAAIFTSIRRLPVKEEIEKSMRQAAIDIRKANIEIHNAIQLKTEMAFDELKMRQDIMQAMQVIGELNLDKLVTTALQQVQAPAFRFAFEQKEAGIRKIKKILPKVTVKVDTDTDTNTSVTMEEL